MTRADRRTLVRQLRDDEGLSQRQIAKRLGVSKDTVRRDLEAEPGDAPRDEPDDATDESVAPQVNEVVGEESAPEAEPDGAPLAEPDEPAVETPAVEAAPRAPLARLPRRLARADELLIDLRGRPTLRRELAVLRQTGAPAEDLIDQAMVVIASVYKQALAQGVLLPGERFEITGIGLRPALRPAPVAPRPEGG